MKRMDVFGIKSGLALLTSFFVYMLGIVNEAIVVLVFFMILDMLTGLLRGWITKSWNSTIGLAGIFKKFAILLLVGMAGGIEYIVISAGQDPQGMVILGVTSFFIVNEGISILENCAQLGLPIPTVLYNALEKLNKEPYGKEQAVERNPHLQQLDRVELIKENQKLHQELQEEKKQN